MRELDFNQDIKDLTEDFTGREWVFAEIDKWLRESDETFFLLTGEPGAGKSALAARLVLNRKIQAFHFCIARQANTIDPLNFARSLSLQLTQLEGFAIFLLEEARIHLGVHIEVRENYGQIIGVQLENLTVKAPSAVEAFNRAVIDPLQKFTAQNRSTEILIVVDGLDEADEHDGPAKIADLLANMAGLPAQVRFIVTARPDSPGLRQLSGLTPITLDLIKNEAKRFRDANEYVNEKVSQSTALKVRLESMGKSVTDFIQELEAKHQGNFRYLSFLFTAIEKGEVWVEDLERLPPGLDGIYRESLRTRAVGKPTLWRAYRPVLGTLAAAQEALTANQIECLSGVTPQEVWDVLQDAGQFIKKTGSEPVYYQLYNQSLVNFLGNPDRAQEYWIDLSAVHQKISKRYAGFIEARNWKDCDGYGLEHLAAHLYQGNLFKLLYTLVEEDWLHAHLDREQYRYGGWLRDVDLVWQAARRQDQASLQALQLMQCIGIQARCALSQASVRSLARNTTPELLRRMVADGLWELDRAVKLTGQIGDGVMQQRCLCTLMRIETLTKEQKSELTALLGSYGGDKTCDELAKAAEKIPGFPFQLNSISDEGRRHLERMLEDNLKDSYDRLSSGFPRKSPLREVLEGELTPPDIDEMARSHWFFQQLGLKLHPTFAQKSENDAVFTLALALGLTPNLANNFFTETVARVGKLPPARKATALWALAPYVSQTSESNLLSLADGLPQDELRLAVIDRLAVHISKSGIKQISETLSAIREDETDRMTLLARLVPHLQQKELKDTALARALSLADSRTGREAELGTRVYADLSNFLTPDGIEKAISHSLGLSYRNTGSLARLLPFVDRDRQQELATEAVSKPLEYEMEIYHGPALVQLGGYLTMDRLTDSLAFHGFHDWGETQSLLKQIQAETGPEGRAMACVEPFLAITFKYFSEVFFDCLVSLLPHIKVTQLPKALSLVDKHRDQLGQNQAWILLATKMESSERDRYLSTVMETTLAEGEQARATLIAITAEYHPEWVTMHAEQYSSAIQALLESAAQKGRGNVLKCLHELLPAWLLFGAGETADGICHAVLNVCEEWEWM